jgi:predicted RNase H-like HicB family nuclease
MAAEPPVRYEIILGWRADDQCYLARVPDLPGWMSDGRTYAEALANVQIIIQEWIETARELGRPIPEPRERLIFG